MRKKVIALFMFVAILMQALIPTISVFAENNISGEDYITDFSMYVDG